MYCNDTILDKDKPDTQEITIASLNRVEAERNNPNQQHHNPAPQPTTSQRGKSSMKKSSPSKDLNQSTNSTLTTRASGNLMDREGPS